MSDATAPDSSIQRAVSWILLGGFQLISGLARGVYGAHEVEPSARFELLSQLGLMVLLWYWFSQQIAKYRPRLIMDVGVFILFLWFILMPYYLWRYERWRGLAKVACVVGMVVASNLLALVTYWVLS